MTTSDAKSTLARPRWPWILLALAMIWTAAIRIPLVLNAESHLDSDLAVDGLTLIDALNGHWRWHFPATPHMGIGPMLLSLPQAMLWGVDSITLVSGGLVAYEAVLVATFLLAWTAFGPRTAAWGLIPLAFSSTGAIWLSGRLTGGHLLTAAWHAGALALLYSWLARGGLRRAIVLGLWCGLGLYLDRMFVFTIAVVLPSVLFSFQDGGPWRRRVALRLAFLLALGVGYLPHEAGTHADPYDAYHEQFSPIFKPDVLQEHARLLGMECLPRLLAGHRLIDYEPEPQPVPFQSGRRTRGWGDVDRLDQAVAVSPLSLAALSVFMLAMDFGAPVDPARRAVRLCILASSALILAGFIFNKNIYNSDNYRYLIYLLIPWSIGFGIAMDWLAREGWICFATSVLLGLTLAALMTVDAARWHRRFEWVDDNFLPIRAAADDPATGWLRDHDEVRIVYGDYWDVYRLSFLTRGRVRGIPFAIYPNRFPEWSRESVEGGSRAVICRKTRSGNSFRRRSIQAGATLLFEAPSFWIYSVP